LGAAAALPATGREAAAAAALPRLALPEAPLAAAGIGATAFTCAGVRRQRGASSSMPYFSRGSWHLGLSQMAKPLSLVVVHTEHIHRADAPDARCAGALGTIGSGAHDTFGLAAIAFGAGGAGDSGFGASATGFGAGAGAGTGNAVTRPRRLASIAHREAGKQQNGLEHFVWSELVVVVQAEHCHNIGFPMSQAISSSRESRKA
jgi:hypothetical protein